MAADDGAAEGASADDAEVADAAVGSGAEGAVADAAAVAAGAEGAVDDASEAADGAEGAVDDAEVDGGVARRFSWRASVVTCFRVSALRSLLSNAKTTWEYLWLPTSRSSCPAMMVAAASPRSPHMDSPTTLPIKSARNVPQGTTGAASSLLPPWGLLEKDGHNLEMCVTNIIACIPYSSAAYRAPPRPLPLTNPMALPQRANAKAKAKAKAVNGASSEQRLDFLLKPVAHVMHVFY